MGEKRVPMNWPGADPTLQGRLDYLAGAPRTPPKPFWVDDQGKCHQFKPDENRAFQVLWLKGYDFEKRG